MKPQAKRLDLYSMLNYIKKQNCSSVLSNCLQICDATISHLNQPVLHDAETFSWSFMRKTNTTLASSAFMLDHSTTISLLDIIHRPVFI
jgi:hypothetical protein